MLANDAIYSIDPVANGSLQRNTKPTYKEITMSKVPTNYYSEIKFTFDDHGYTIDPFSDDAYSDAYSDVLFGVDLVEPIADWANGIDDPKEFEDYLAKVNVFINYLKAGGYFDSDYKVTFVNKRKYASRMVKLP